VAQFKHGDFSICDVPHPGQPKTVTTLEIIVQIHKLILEARRISAKSIAEQLGISRGRVGSIIHDDMGMQKLTMRWVPKRLNADQNVNGTSCLNNFGIFFGAIQMISCRNW
jgi:predicted XRE-type DNA-binding protein